MTSCHRTCARMDPILGHCCAACLLSPAAISVDVSIKHLNVHQGVDGGVEVPFTRWELEEVWDPNPDAQGKMHHGGRKKDVG